VCSFIRAQSSWTTDTRTLSQGDAVSAENDIRKAVEIIEIALSKRKPKTDRETLIKDYIKENEVAKQTIVVAKKELEAAGTYQKFSKASGSGKGSKKPQKKGKSKDKNTTTSSDASGKSGFAQGAEAFSRDPNKYRYQ
jgi:hypothetical protein